MYRTLLALAVGLLAAATATADLGPPRGFKLVPVDHRFTTEKEYPDYLFFAVSGGKGPRAKLTPLTIDPKTPGVFPGAGRTGIGRLGTLVAVPKDAAKKYDSEEKFHAAVKNQEVEGMLKTSTRLDSQVQVKDTDARKVVVREHSVEKVDPKEGIVLKTKPDTAAPSVKKDSPDDEDEPTGPTAHTPRGGVWVAGLAATLGLMLGGFWLAGRGRRKM